MHPPFKVAVAGEHRGHHEVAFGNGRRNSLRQGPRIADAGGAAVAHQIESQRIERGLQARLAQILGHHLGAGRKGGLHPRFDLQATLQGLFRHQARPQHDRRVGGVGTGGDGGDDHRAMTDFLVRSGQRNPRIDGRRTALQLQGRIEGRGHLRHGHPVLGPFGPGQARNHGGQVQRQRVGVGGFLGGRIAPQPLGLGVSLHQGHSLRRTAAQFQVVDGLPVDGEKPAGGAVLRRHVGDGRPVRQGQSIQAVAEELDELAHHAVLAQHLHHPQHQVRGGDAFRQAAGQPKADHIGNEHGHRLAEHGRLRLNAAHAPAEHAEAVDHGGVAVGSDQGVGVGQGAAVLRTGPNGLGQMLQVDLVANAGAGRHDAKIVKRRLPPAQETVTLLVAGHLHFDVVAERPCIAEAINHHRVVDDQIDGREGIDEAGVEARIDHGAAHGGQIGHRRYAGEVLHEHPGRTIGDLFGARGVVRPIGQRFDVAARHGGAVLVAKQVLQQDLERHRQPGDGARARRRRLRQAVVVVVAPGRGQRPLAVEAVFAHGGVLDLPA